MEEINLHLQVYYIISMEWIDIFEDRHGIRKEIEARKNKKGKHEIDKKEGLPITIRSSYVQAYL